MLRGKGLLALFTLQPCHMRITSKHFFSLSSWMNSAIGECVFPGMVSMCGHIRIIGKHVTLFEQLGLKADGHFLSLDDH